MKLLLIVMAKIQARILLWDQSKMQAFPLSTFTRDRSKILRMIQQLSIVESIANLCFGKGYQISWQDDTVTVDVAREKPGSVDTFVHHFQDGAADGYLEGDAVVHRSHGTDYEFVLDDFRVQTDRKGATLEYPNYWRA